jgi:acyl carrier protein
MEKIDEIFKVVVDIIEGSIGTPKEEIELNQTLFDELEIDSIDLVDILFELESHYGIELKVSDIESRAREELGDTPYEINGVITDTGLKMLRKHMTEIEPSSLKEGLTIHGLVRLFSVHSLCKIIQYRIEILDKGTS